VTVAAMTTQEWRERVQGTGDYNLVNQLSRDAGYDPMALRSSRRHQEYVEGRRIVAKALRALGWSYPRIGRGLGNRNHVTIMNLCGVLRRSAKRLTPSTPVMPAEEET
jgi:hypothetical protein